RRSLRRIEAPPMFPSAREFRRIGSPSRKPHSVRGGLLLSSPGRWFICVLHFTRKGEAPRGASNNYANRRWKGPSQSALIKKTATSEAAADEATHFEAALRSRLALFQD